MKKDYDIVLVDYSWLLARSFYAYKKMNLGVIIDEERVYTGDVYGVLDTLQRIKTVVPVAVIMLCVDSKTEDGTYLNKASSEEYKAGRTEKKECFSKYDVILGLGCLLDDVYVARTYGMEADEVIVALAHAGVEKGKKVLLYAKDKDMCQAVVGDTVVKAHQIKSGKFYDVLNEARVTERFGCPPYRLPMWQAIKGDAIDGVPGYTRFLSKHAGVIASTFATPDELFARDKEKDLPRNVERQAKKLDAWKDQMKSNFKMVRMTDLDMKDVKITRPEADRSLLRKWKLFKFIAALDVTGDSFKVVKI